MIRDARAVLCAVCAGYGGQGQLGSGSKENLYAPKRVEIPSAHARPVAVVSATTIDPLLPVCMHVCLPVPCACLPACLSAFAYVVTRCLLACLLACLRACLRAVAVTRGASSSSLFFFFFSHTTHTSSHIPQLSSAYR
jgi:hypothetical protein